MKHLVKFTKEGHEPEYRLLDEKDADTHREFSSWDYRIVCFDVHFIDLDSEREVGLVQ